MGDATTTLTDAALGQPPFSLTPEIKKIILRDLSSGMFYELLQQNKSTWKLGSAGETIKQFLQFIKKMAEGLRHEYE